MQCQLVSIQEATTPVAWQITLETYLTPRLDCILAAKNELRYKLLIHSAYTHIHTHPYRLYYMSPI